MSSIDLKFYNEDDEVVATHVAHRVKTKFLKTAIRLSKEIDDPKNIGEEQVNALLDFIVELFGDKFTRDELEEQSDLFECMNVLQAVFARANSLALQHAKSNPTLQLPKKK
jgi:hypothetical protein